MNTSFVPCFYKLKSVPDCLTTLAIQTDLPSASLNVLLSNHFRQVEVSGCLISEAIVIQINTNSSGLALLPINLLPQLFLNRFSKHYKLDFGAPFKIGGYSYNYLILEVLKNSTSTLTYTLPVTLAFTSVPIEIPEGEGLDFFLLDLDFILN